ncbi:MAG: tetratricopeptide repeat protein [Microgenomates group bacterium]
MINIEELEQSAIDAAIATNWEKAIEINEKIIKLDNKNIDAYLRLGFAYLQKGNLKKAKKAYLQVKKLQTNNVLANEQLEKIKVLETKKTSIKPVKTNLDPYTFADVPGKTKTVSLVNCGQKTTLANLFIGQKVNLIPKKKRIEVRTDDKEYIGCLPDDLSKKLNIFIKAGSIFDCYIKEADLKNVTVFIKEIKKGKKVLRYTTFPTNTQNNLKQIIDEENNETEESEEITDYDLDQLAELLTNNEEKEDYISFPTNKNDEEMEE